MPARAAVFDIGDVLEIAGPPTWTASWPPKLGLTQQEFDAALEQVDPQGLAVTGGLGETQLRCRYVKVLGLSSAQADLFMADIWDWYCGVLDQELVEYARGLRPRLKTGILSNSADGARREEHGRYRLPDLVDVTVYSHEVGLAKPDPAIFLLICERLGVEPAEVVFIDDLPANVAAAEAVGMAAVLHRFTPDTIAAVEHLLGPREGRLRRR